MIKEYINENGPEVSATVYSFWRWTEKDLEDTKQFRDIVAFTQELGITTYDLSPRFANGKVETEFGKLVKEGVINQEELVVITKVGVRHHEEFGEYGTYYDLTPRHIVESVEASLNRLQLNSIDILILEHFDFLIHFEETASALLKLQLKGKVKHFGVSNFNVFQQRVLSSTLNQPIITNQIELNLLQTEALHDGRLDFIREQYSRVLAFSPLADGEILSGDSLRSVRLRKALEEVSSKYNANIEQIAVAWLYKLGAIPIIGSKEKSRIQNGATAYNFQLTQKDWYYLYNATL